MNGAESLVRTLVNGGVNVCFTNPGTSEMHFVAALDKVDGMRCVLALFEGVATGAADGYARMTGRPASTLLHLGPGLGNGLANLHNADSAWTEGGVIGKPVALAPREKVDDKRIEEAAKMLKAGNAALLLNGPMLAGEAAELCGKVAAAPRAELPPP